MVIEHSQHLDYDMFILFIYVYIHMAAGQNLVPLVNVKKKMNKPVVIGMFIRRPCFGI